MLRLTRSIRGYAIQCVDGRIGQVDQLFFDDLEWMVRYFVVHTSGWLLRNKVLVSPHSIKSIASEAKYVDVSLTKRQLENSPDIDTDRPVSRQMEIDYYDYFGLPYYWSAAGAWISPSIPRLRLPDSGDLKPDRLGGELPKAASSENHLRSGEDVIDYRIEAADDEFGHVIDLIFDDENWRVRYLVVDTVNWWPSKTVCIPAEWVGGIDWNEMRFKVNLKTTQIKSSPEFQADRSLNRGFEERLYAHYHRPGYWVKDKVKDRVA